MQEKQKKYRKFLWYALVGTLLSLFILIYGTMKDHIPDEIFVYADEETDWETFFQEPLISYDETVEVSQNGSYQIRCKWLGVLPLKTIKVHTVEKQEVLVSGSPVGIYMETKGVLVIDSGEITDREGIRRTPAEHIIQSGDYICEIDGKVLTGKRQLMQLVRENQGEPMELQVIRHQETIKLEMTPVEHLRMWSRTEHLEHLVMESVTQTREKDWKFLTVIFTVQIFFLSVKVQPVHRGNFGV